MIKRLTHLHLFKSVPMALFSSSALDPFNSLSPLDGRYASSTS